MDKQLYGDHETQVSEGGEADLHKHLIGCKKNPGHTQFIPVDTFTFNHLPDYDLYECIKTTADLTVRVDVKMTSPYRPEFWPDTSFSYPFYNMRDKTNLRTGSGWVSGRVYKFTDGISNTYGGELWSNYTTCWCKKCQHSDTASHVWWEFYVCTATHVVFGDIEASHTTLRLFYDREDSPVVSVDQVSVGDVNNESDLCELKCVTCDKNLGDKLNMLRRHYYDVWRKVYYKYFESRDEDKLNFIVSHPHGCSKQISFGHWVDKYKASSDVLGPDHPRHLGSKVNFKASASWAFNLSLDFKAYVDNQLIMTFPKSVYNQSCGSQMSRHFQFFNQRRDLDNPSGYPQVDIVLYANHPDNPEGGALNCSTVLCSCFRVYYNFPPGPGNIDIILDPPDAVCFSWKQK